jgi:hypothetical protein
VHNSYEKEKDVTLRQQIKKKYESFKVTNGELFNTNLDLDKEMQVIGEDPSSLCNSRVKTVIDSQSRSS